MKIMTIILSLHLSAAVFCWQVLNASGWWAAIAAIFLGCHLFALCGMALMFYVIFDAAICAVASKKR